MPAAGNLTKEIQNSPQLNRQQDGFVQHKLELGRPDDKFEKEADAVADQVMMKPAIRSEAPPMDGNIDAPIMQMKPAEVSEIQMKCEECEEEESIQMKSANDLIMMAASPPDDEDESVQMMALGGTIMRAEEDEESVQMSGNTIMRAEEDEENVRMKPAIQKSSNGKNYVSSDISSQIASTKGGGTSLAPDVSAEMGNKIGADFSGVKIHTNSQSAQMNRAIGAQAFTYGSDIYFNKGKYNPSSPAGKHLLAHELTHTVQQGAAVQTKPQISRTQPRVQGLFDSVREQLNEYARYIPGWTLLTLIAGYNPLLGRSVEATGENLVGGLLELIPVFGVLLMNKLREHNILADAFTWVRERLGSLDLSLSRIERTIDTVNDQINWRQVPWNLPDHIVEVLRRNFVPLMNDVMTFVTQVGERILQMVKEVLMTALKAIADAFPGYPLLTKVLGFDPLTGEEVISTTAEKIEDFLILIGKESELERMQAEGTIQETADWIDQELALLDFSLEEIQLLFTTAWDAFSMNDLSDPVAAFNRTVAIFQPFVTRVFTFAYNVAVKVLEFIKNALLSQLSAFAREQRGYHLLTVLLGKDPFTDEVVERNVENVIRGFMSLMDGGEEQFQQMKKSGAIEQASARVDAAVEELGFNLSYIVGLFIGLWNSFTIDDVFDPIGAFVRIVETLGEPLLKLAIFVIRIIRIVIEVLLEIMQFPFETINSIINNASQAFEDIKRDPIGFLKNLLRAVKEGFSQFFENILTHLLNGLRDWLFGELAAAGITPPADITFQSILGFVLDTLGISIDNIWERLALKIGPERVAQIRGAIDTLTGIWTFISDVYERGPIAIWEYIQEQLSNLWGTLLGMIRNWVMTRIITAVTTKLLSMLDPTGIMAVINSFIAFYRGVQSFIEKLREMLEIINSFVAGVANIARGNISEAANYLENALARGIPVAIGFLANQVSLGGLGARVAEMIEGLREKVNGAIDWLIDKALAAGGALLQIGRNVVSSITGWTRRLLGIENQFEAQDGSEHKIFFQESGNDITLMINPTPAGPLVPWINNLNVADPQNKTRALSKAQEIEAKKAETISESDPSRQEAAEEQKARDTRTLVDQLSAIIGPFFGGEGVRPECATESNGGLQFGSLRNGYGTNMAARFLTNQGMPSGSSPSVGDESSTYSIINRRRSGNGSFYVKGHLLNELLGGTGRAWKNLTPLTRVANSEHERIAERRVKDAVNAGNIVEYNVRAEYGQSAGSSADPQIQEVMNEEAKIPSRLICSADLVAPAEVSDSGSEERTSLVPSGTVIQNDISGEYDLIGGAREIIYLNSATIDQISDIENVTGALARKIVDASSENVSGFRNFSALANYQFSDNRLFTEPEKIVINGLSNISYVRLYQR